MNVVVNVNLNVVVNLVALAAAAILASCTASGPPPVQPKPVVAAAKAVTATAPPRPTEAPPPAPSAPEDGEAQCLPSAETGTLRGKAVFSDKTSPAKLTGSASRQRAGWRHFRECDGQYEDFPKAGAPAGDFVFEGLPPGIYDLTLTGDDFVSLDVDPFVVEAGKVKDLGTLLLDRGRTLRGRVLKADRTPAAGVQVLAGDDLWGDEKSLLGSIARSATTLPDGTFTLTALGRGPVIAAADSKDLGRSVALKLPAGDADLASELQLVATGALTGKVTYLGAAAQADITAQPAGMGNALRLSASTDKEGRYRFERLAEGAYTITAQLIRGDLHALVHPARAAQVSISATKEARLDLDIPTGSLVVIHAKVARGAADMVSAVLVKGTFSAKTEADIERALNDLDLEHVRQADTHLSKGADMEITDVTAGPYTLCGSGARYGDSRATMKAQPATCTPVTIAPGGKRQELTLSVIGH